MYDQWQEVDRNVVGGILLGFLMFILAAMLSGGVLNFFSISAGLVVLGGTCAAVVVQFSPEVFHRAYGELHSIVYPQPEEGAEERHNYLEHLSRLVKKKGLVVLDHEAQRVEDPYLHLALELSSDRCPPEQLQRILSHEIATTYQKQMKVVELFEAMATYCPAMGLVGTIIGLVNMMDSLGNISGLGPALSVALLTTLYGAILSHLVFAPIAGKLRDREESRAHIKRLTLEGVMSLAQEENPILFQQRLKSFGTRTETPRGQAG